jgi:hypothetical protein
MFPLNTILAWSINIIMNKKYDNNNIIIASSAYFLHPLVIQRFFIYQEAWILELITRLD